MNQEICMNIKVHSCAGSACSQLAAAPAISQPPAPDLRQTSLPWVAIGHAIVTAQKRSVQRWHFQNGDVGWSLKYCCVKSYVTGLLTQMLFQWFFVHAGSSHMIKYNEPKGYGISERRGLWVLCMIHLMSRRNPCRHYIHLAFTYSVNLWSVTWSELGPAPPFPTIGLIWECLKCNGHGTSVIRIS